MTGGKALMRHLLSTFACVALAFVAAGAVAQTALADALCVDAKKPGCFSEIQAALDAASDGDTIAVGAGAGATTIRGGGPVITIGEPDGIDQPTVSIGRMTITGGLNGSTPLPFA